MIYLLDKFDPELFEFKEGRTYMAFDMFETSEERVKRWMSNERVRSIFSKQEIMNLFEVGGYMQMVKVERIRLSQFDKVVLWTRTGRFFVISLRDYFK